MYNNNRYTYKCMPLFLKITQSTHVLIFCYNNHCQIMCKSCNTCTSFPNRTNIVLHKRYMYMVLYSRCGKELFALEVKQLSKSIWVVHVVWSVSEAVQYCNCNPTIRVALDQLSILSGSSGWNKILLGQGLVVRRGGGCKCICMIFYLHSTKGKLLHDDISPKLLI